MYELENNLSDYIMNEGLFHSINIVDGKIDEGYILNKVCSVYYDNNKKDYYIKEDGLSVLNAKTIFLNIDLNKKITNKKCLNSKCIFNTCPYLTVFKQLNKNVKRSKVIEGKSFDIDIQISRNISNLKLKNDLLNLKDVISFSLNNNNDYLINTIILNGDNKNLKKKTINIIKEIYSLNEDNLIYEEIDLLENNLNNFNSDINYIKNYDKFTEINHINSLSLLNKISNIENDKVIILDSKLDFPIKNSNCLIIEIPDYNKEELIELFKNNLKEKNIEINDEILIYLNNEYMENYIKENSNLKNDELIDKLVIEVINNLSKRNSNLLEISDFKKSLDYEDRIKLVEERLNNLVGLQSVKKQLKELISYLVFLNKTKNKINLPTLNLHAVFTGNPGTGKTTIARIYAEILYTLGYIKENKLIEVGREDLIAEYVGQTAVKTKAVFDRAMGGVLFIDEAYSLTPTNGNGFEAECISTIIKLMEDNRDKIVVIFAGYKNDMEKFLDSNEGLRSRITSEIFFNDYSVEELYLIFKNSLKELNLNLDSSAKDKIINIISKAKNDNRFGNGRYIMNLRQKVLMKHALNTSNEIDEDLLLTITEKDFD